MSKELTTEEYYNKLWLENKELIQENIDRLNKKRFAQVLMPAEKDKEIERLHSIIKEVREYIENNSLYEQDYDYDYEENLTEYPPSDEQARKDILSILDKEN